MDQPTREEKLLALTDHAASRWTYRFKAPPVPHTAWAPSDWVAYIDASGGWCRKPRPDLPPGVLSPLGPPSL